MATHRVIAVVVTYRPDLAVLSQLLEQLALQVKHTVIVDNTDLASVIKSESSHQQTWLRLDDNTGIAHAQNLGIQLAKQLGATHVLLMDQDSLPTHNMVQCQLDALASESSEHVAAIGPICSDVKTGSPPPLIQRHGWRITRVNPQKLTRPISVEYIPASGTLIPLGMLEQVGLMRAEYFIDRVDVEWCLRARKMGLSIWVTPSTVMQHDQGNSAIQLLGRTLYIGHDFRAYFHVRNSVAMALRAHIPMFWRIDHLFKIFPYIILYTATARTGRLRIARILLTALLDGLRGRMGKGYYQQRPLS